MNLIAAIQMNSTANLEENLHQAERLIAQAAELGAQLVVLPENFVQMSRETDKLDICETPGQGPVQSFLAEQAAKHGIWLIGGTIPLRTDDDQRVRASCLLFDEHGQQVARYDKIHLFDVEIMDSQESYKESATIEPGQDPVVVETPFGRLGLAVCYDLRFPELFRRLLDRGMEILALPAAFTAATGRAHWEVLLRARAIENQCYVIAAAQTGRHVTGRETFGDSMIIDPWGVVVERLPSESGVVIAALDRERQYKIRRTFPALDHRHPLLNSN